jgi:hypothetical protein
MTGQEIFNVVGGALLTLLGWLGRQLWDAVTELRRDIKSIEVSLPTHYVSKDQMTEFKIDIDARFDRLEDMMNRMFDKIDGKVDK